MWKKSPAICSSPLRGYQSLERTQKKACGVCGDLAKSLHFGGFSCNSCKAFFRRSVQNEAYKTFICAYNGKCEISVFQRRGCQQCRFQKCLKNGMEVRWVMSEEDRQKLKAKKEAKRSLDASPKKVGLPEFLNHEERHAVRTLIENLKDAIRQYPFAIASRKGEKATHVFVNVVLRCIHVNRNLPAFASLPAHDQLILMREAILEVYLLTGASAYAQDSNTYLLYEYTKSDNEEAIVPVPMEVEEMKKIMSPELYEKNLRFIRGFQELKPDARILLLMGILVLCCPERQGLSDPARVSALQEKFIIIMKKYTVWRYGASAATTLFPKFLTKLSDLQELSDYYTEEHVRLGPGDVEELQEKLGQLSLNPYKHIDISKYGADGPVSPGINDASCESQQTDALCPFQSDPTASPPPEESTSPIDYPAAIAPDGSILCDDPFGPSDPSLYFGFLYDQEDTSAHHSVTTSSSEGSINTPEFREESWFHDLQSCPELKQETLEDKGVLEGDLAWIDDLLLPPNI